MAYVSFYRGLKANYNETTHQDCIYFATDTLEILLNNTTYGGGVISDAVFSDGKIIITFLDGTSKEIEIPEATDTDSGLMSAEDKQKIDELLGDSDGSLTDLITQLEEKVDEHIAEKNLPGGYAGLDESGLISSDLLPSYVDDVIDVYAVYGLDEVGNLLSINLYEDAEHLTTVTGETGKIYVDITEDSPHYQFRWSGTAFVLISSGGLILGSVTGTAYDGAEGTANRAAIDSLPLNIVTSIVDATATTETVIITIDETSKDEDTNVYDSGTNSEVIIPAATDSSAGVMTAEDKQYIEAIKDQFGEVEDLDILLKSNAGIGVIAEYTSISGDVQVGDTIAEAIAKVESKVSTVTGDSDSSLSDLEQELDEIKDIIGNPSDGEDPATGIYLDLEELESRVATNETNIGIINGDSETEGSIDYKISLALDWYEA